jgi:hypothetical protein
MELMPRGSGVVLGVGLGEGVMEGVGVADGVVLGVGEADGLGAPARTRISASDSARS